MMLLNDGHSTHLRSLVMPPHQLSCLVLIKQTNVNTAAPINHKLMTPKGAQELLSCIFINCIIGKAFAILVAVSPTAKNAYIGGQPNNNMIGINSTFVIPTDVANNPTPNPKDEKNGNNESHPVMIVISGNGSICVIDNDIMRVARVATAENQHF